MAPSVRKSRLRGAAARPIALYNDRFLILVRRIERRGSQKKDSSSESIRKRVVDSADIFRLWCPTCSSELPINTAARTWVSS